MAKLGKQRYLSKWEADLDKQTVNDVKIKIGEWCRKSRDPYNATCFLCQKEIYVGAMGKAALYQHAKRDKHISAYIAKMQQPRIHVNVEPVKIVTDDCVLGAEMRWSAFIAEHDLPPNIATHSANLFASMFPDSDIARQFACSRTKASYLISDGFGSILHKELVKDLQTHKFSVLIDESNKSYGNKFLNILVKFFENDKVVTKFYKSIKIKQSTSEEITQALNSSFENDQIPWRNVLQVMSDSPNVMRGSKGGVLKKIKDRFAPNLIDIGGCSLHHVSNAVSYGIDALGEEVETFVVDLHAFFKHRCGLVQEFHDIQTILDIPEHQILRFVSTRWLCIYPVVERILEQWEALKCFFGNMYKKHPDVAKQDRTKLLSAGLNDPILLAKLHFIRASLPKFNAYEKLFQANNSQIHVLHIEMCELLRTTMVQFVKPDLIETATTTKGLMQVQFDKIDNQLEDKRLPIGELTTKCLAEVNREKKKCFFLDVRKFFKVVVQKLLAYFPIECKTLQDIQFLHPGAQKEQTAVSAVKRIASTFSPLCNEINVEKIEEEWRRYSIENYEEKKDKLQHDIASYWSSVLAESYPSGDLKFPSLAVLVKMVLSLAHGNADTERSFSQVARIITKNRHSISVHTLNGLMKLNSEMKDVHAHTIMLSNERLTAGRRAFATYNKRQEDEKKAKKSEQMNKDLDDNVQKLNEVLQKQNKIAAKEREIEKSKTNAENLCRNIDNLLEETKAKMKEISKESKIRSLKEKELDKMKRHAEPAVKRKRQTKSEKPLSKQRKLTDVFVINVEKSEKPEKESKKHLGITDIQSKIGESVLDKMKGDGNCFFRAVSKEIFSSEEAHMKMRQLITNFMEENKHAFQVYIDGDKDNHIAEMKKLGTWATQAELFATASMLGKEIFVLAPQGNIYKWCLFPPKVKHDCSFVTCKCFVALCNTDACHYDRVIDPSGKCNCGRKRPTSDW